MAAFIQRDVIGAKRRTQPNIQNMLFVETTCVAPPPLRHQKLHRPPKKIPVTTKSLYSISLVFITLLLLAGCDSTEPDEREGPVILDFDFGADGSGWQPGFVDYPDGREADVEFVGDHREMPPPYAPDMALYQRGFNLSDDLFMYFKHRVDGLDSDTEYETVFVLEFATNYGEDCVVGVGAGVFLKAGASAIEPVPVLDSDNNVRLNVDKGQQQNDGDNALLLGDIRNGRPGCGADVRYSTESVTSDARSVRVRPNEDGEVWLFFGSESAFESPHQVYFTHFHVEFTPTAAP
jgi:hypothetical protein